MVGLGLARPCLCLCVAFAAEVFLFLQSGRLRWAEQLPLIITERGEREREGEGGIEGREMKRDAKWGEKRPKETTKERTRVYTFSNR